MRQWPIERSGGVTGHERNSPVSATVRGTRSLLMTEINPVGPPALTWLEGGHAGAFALSFVPASRDKRCRICQPHYLFHLQLTGSDLIKMQHGTWSNDEHDRFLAAIKIYPKGPWRHIASYVGTRSVRQVQSHAQKYHEKVARRKRGLRKERRQHARQEHRIDDELLDAMLNPMLPPAFPVVTSPVAGGFLPPLQFSGGFFTHQPLPPLHSLHIPHSPIQWQVNLPTSYPIPSPMGMYA